MAYSQPRSSIRWISRIFIAGLLSIIIGTIFWDIPGTDPQLLNGDRYLYQMICLKIIYCIETFKFHTNNNISIIYILFRLGFYYSTMIIGALPLILQIALTDTHGNDRDAVESDIADSLYSRVVYIVTSVSQILYV